MRTPARTRISSSPKNSDPSTYCNGSPCARRMTRFFRRLPGLWWSVCCETVIACCLSHLSSLRAEAISRQTGRSDSKVLLVARAFQMSRGRMRGMDVLKATERMLSAICGLCHHSQPRIASKVGIGEGETVLRDYCGIESEYLLSSLSSVQSRAKTACREIFEAWKVNAWSAYCLIPEPWKVIRVWLECCHARLHSVSLSQPH